MNVKIAKEFPRTNIAIAILFNILTLGFYSIYWLQRKASFLRSKMPQNSLPIAEINFCYLILLLFWIHSFSYIYIYFVVKIILLFDIRSKIHILLKINNRHQLWFHPVFTFLFGFLYMTYKIDQFPHNKHTEEAPPIQP